MVNIGTLVKSIAWRHRTTGYAEPVAAVNLTVDFAELVDSCVPATSDKILYVAPEWYAARPIDRLRAQLEIDYGTRARYRRE